MENRVYGLMITKNDDEAFKDWCKDQLPLYDAVICLDGSEDGRTREIAQAFPNKLVLLDEGNYPVDQKTDHGLRRVVHEEIVRRFGCKNWVMCCHADEFVYHDPRKVVVKATEQGYDSVSWFSVHFYPHPREFRAWDELKKRQLPDRLSYYHWGFRGSGLPWREDRLYRNSPDVRWDGVTHGSVRPHGLFRRALFFPILCHYKVLTLDLNEYDLGPRSTHYRTHWEGLQHRTGLPFPVKRPEDFFVSRIPDYDYCNRFDGTFDHPWNMGEEYRPDHLSYRDS